MVHFLCYSYFAPSCLNFKFLNLLLLRFVFGIFLQRIKPFLQKLLPPVKFTFRVSILDGFIGGHPIGKQVNVVDEKDVQHKTDHYCKNQHAHKCFLLEEKFHKNQSPSWSDQLT
jgi:hypothetical protein